MTCLGFASFKECGGFKKATVYSWFTIFIFNLFYQELNMLMVLSDTYCFEVDNLKHETFKGSR